MLFSKFLPNPLTSYESQSDFCSNRIGEISEDNSAILGKNSWSFIYQGTNNYFASYQESQLAELTYKWANIIEKRKYLCHLLNTKFLQIIIPNKATLIPELYPKSLKYNITPALNTLLDFKLDCLICPIKLIHDANLEKVVFRKNDSHMTIAGNAFISDTILKSLGLTINQCDYIKTTKIKHVGDLGNKFNQKIVEEFHAPDFSSGLLNQENIIKVDDFSVDGYNGSYQYFKNPYGLFNNKVIVFGNSFFEKNPSWGMSPIFISLFKEYYFYWSPSIDFNIIKRINPDYVVAQTCERFLNKLPHDSF